MKELSEAFGKFVFSFGMALVLGIYNAWLFKDVWNWFISPAIGVGTIGTAMAYGLLMAFAWPLTHLHLFTQSVYDDGDKAKRLGTVARGVVGCFAHTIAWLLAYVVANNFL